MKYAFRVDSSVTMGSGHVMRWLTLAQGLRNRGAECCFVSRELLGHISAIILDADFDLTLLSPPEGAAPKGPPTHAFLAGVDWRQDARETLAILKKSPPDCLIVDHYAFDKNWEDAARPSNTKLMVIDDLADREHSADLLLDQNLGRLSADYDSFLLPHAVRLIGPKFALLRPEFALARPTSLKRRAEPVLRHIMISMGGADSQNATGAVLNVLAEADLPKDAKITVVMGSTAPFLELVQLRVATMPFPTTVHVDVTNMADLMIEADLAIGGAGSTSWERCCLGVPCLMLVLADNQKAAANALSKNRAGILLGDFCKPRWPEKLNKAIQELKAPKAIQAMSKSAAEFVDGLGTDRCIAAISKKGGHEKLISFARTHIILLSRR